jgi:hypothetical protein
MTHHAIALKDPRPQREDDLQRYTVQLLKLNGVRGLVWFAVPNGEARSKVTGARLKALGVRPGVADFALTLPGGRSAYLELKTPAGRPSPEQKVFRADAETAGALYAIARTPEEVQATLAAWGALRRSARPSEAASARAAE